MRSLVSATTGNMSETVYRNETERGILGWTRRGQDELDETERSDDDVMLADEHVRPLLAGYALGSLDPHETEIVARHVQSCATCRAELADYELVTGVLGYAAPVEPVPLRVRAALLGQVAEIGSRNPEQMVVLPRAPRPEGFWSRRLAKMSAMAAIPAAVIVILIVTMVAMGERINQQQEQLAVAEEQQTTYERTLMSETVTDNPRFTTDFVTSNVAPTARGRLFIDRPSNTALVLAVDLPIPADGESYIVWLRFVGGDEYARAGVLDVGTDGRARLPIESIDALSRFSTVVVTVEADPSVPAPSGPELMTAGMVGTQ